MNLLKIQLTQDDFMDLNFQTHSFLPHKSRNQIQLRLHSFLLTQTEISHTTVIPSHNEPVYQFNSKSNQETEIQISCSKCSNSLSSPLQSRLHQKHSSPREEELQLNTQTVPFSVFCQTHRHPCLSETMNTTNACLSFHQNANWAQPEVTILVLKTRNKNVFWQSLVCTVPLSVSRSLGLVGILLVCVVAAKWHTHTGRRAIYSVKQRSRKT